MTASATFEAGKHNYGAPNVSEFDDVVAAYLLQCTATANLADPVASIVSDIFGKIGYQSIKVTGVGLELALLGTTKSNGFYPNPYDAANVGNYEAKYGSAGELTLKSFEGTTRYTPGHPLANGSLGDARLFNFDVIEGGDKWQAMERCRAALHGLFQDCANKRRIDLWKRKKSKQGKAGEDAATETAEWTAEDFQREYFKAAGIEQAAQPAEEDVGEDVAEWDGESDDGVSD